MANVLKHADARHVAVSLSITPRTLRIEVVDDGHGFDPATISGPGLRGLRDRIEALGGNIAIASRAGRGTVLTACLPIEVGRDG